MFHNKGLYCGNYALFLIAIAVPTTGLAMDPMNEESADFVARRIVETFAKEIQERNIPTIRLECRRFNGEAHTMNQSFGRKLGLQMRRLVPGTKVSVNSSDMIIIKFFRDFGDDKRKSIVQVHAVLVADGRPVAEKKLDDATLGQLSDYMFVAQYGEDKGDLPPPRTVVAVSAPTEMMEDFRKHAADLQAPIQFVGTKVTEKERMSTRSVVVHRNSKPYYELSMYVRGDGGDWNQVEFSGIATDLRGNVSISPNKEYKLKVKNITSHPMGFRLDIDGLGWEQFRDKACFSNSDKVIMVCDPGESHEFEGWLKNDKSKWPFKTELPGDFGLRKGLADIGRIQIQAVWGCPPKKVAAMESTEGAYFAQSKGSANRIQTVVPKQGDKVIHRRIITDTRDLVWESLKEADARSLCWFHLVPE